MTIHVVYNNYKNNLLSITHNSTNTSSIHFCDKTWLFTIIINVVVKHVALSASFEYTFLMFYSFTTGIDFECQNLKSVSAPKGLNLYNYDSATDCLALSERANTYMYTMSVSSNMQKKSHFKIKVILNFIFAHIVLVENNHLRLRNTTWAQI